MEENTSWIEIRNGDKLLFADSVSSEPITGYSVYMDTLFNFRDSLYVKEVSRDSSVRYGFYKLKKADFVIVNLAGLSFETFSTNKRIGGI